MTIPNNMTHTGEITGNDARTPDGFRQRMYLRETPKFWIGKHGQKYRKSDGAMSPRTAWPMYSLDIASVAPIVT